jgi:hypothetical protein
LTVARGERRAEMDRAAHSVQINDALPKCIAADKVLSKLRKVCPTPLVEQRALGATTTRLFV